MSTPCRCRRSDPRTEARVGPLRGNGWRFGHHVRVDRGRRLGLEDLLLGVTLVGYQVALLLAMRDTSTTDDGDPFDSTVYRWSWLLLPAAALLASFIRPDGRRPVLWTAALIVPLAIEVALLGAVWYDPDQGASLWLVGEVFVAVQGAVILGAAKAGAALRLRRSPPVTGATLSGPPCLGMVTPMLRRWAGRRRESSRDGGRFSR
jgi:hypothetical protein